MMQCPSVQQHIKQHEHREKTCATQVLSKSKRIMTWKASSRFRIPLLLSALFICTDHMSSAIIVKIARFIRPCEVSHIIFKGVVAFKSQLSKGEYTIILRGTTLKGIYHFPSKGEPIILSTNQ